MAGITTLPDYATTRQSATISAPIHKRPEIGIGKSTLAPTFFSNLEGLAVEDKNNLAITAIIKGREVPGTIVDGGSGVNVISQRTCDTLGIQEWEPCPYCLRMADTSSVRPARLIKDLEVTIRGHIFPISAMLLWLNTQGAYPLLLG